MPLVTLASGDFITVSLDGKEHKSIIREVIETSDKSYVLSLEPLELGNPIKVIQVDCKQTQYLRI